MSDVSAAPWIVLGSSVRGASHKRAGLPNQDAIHADPRIDVASRIAAAEPPLILAISDGHGSPRSFRSDTGALTAAQIGVERTREFIDHFQAEKLSREVIRDVTSNRLPAEIVRSWKKEVRDHMIQHPFTEEELRRVEAVVGAEANELAEDQGFYLAYGATLIVVAIAASYVLFLQIGDGDILSVDDDGESVEVPIPPDTSMIGNETASLCLPNAQNLFRSAFWTLEDRRPGLIAVSTDGYSNSFTDIGSFQKIGPDFLRLIRTRGVEYVCQEMETWLDQASERGSGDDITLGLLVRYAGAATPADVPTIDFEAQAQEREGHAL
jgi:hypothetical protein